MSYRWNPVFFFVLGLFSNATCSATLVGTNTLAKFNEESKACVAAFKESDKGVEASKAYRACLDAAQAELKLATSENPQFHEQNHEAQMKEYEQQKEKHGLSAEHHQEVVSCDRGSPELRPACIATADKKYEDALASLGLSNSNYPTAQNNQSSTQNPSAGNSQAPANSQAGGNNAAYAEYRTETQACFDAYNSSDMSDQAKETRRECVIAARRALFAVVGWPVHGGAH